VSDQQIAPPRVSAIVPAWNDHANLARLLPAIVGLRGVHEIIVVDATRNATTRQMVTAAGAIYLAVNDPNRGAQLNLGAAHASGDTLIFHHADSILTSAHIAAITHALTDPAIIGGAFYRKFDGRHPHLLWLEKIARFLSRHGGSFFGDQSIFVRRGTFRALGGFAGIPLMEDMEFSRRIRRAGKVVVLDPPMASSTRRHIRRGAWRVSVQNGLFILLYKCGVSPFRLHRWYYREQLCPPNELLFPAQSVQEASPTLRRHDFCD
jgi:rSAM/selenodomain-associated transferase 2